VSNFFKGCLFILLIQCFAVVHIFQMQPVNGEVSVEKFSASDTDPTNDVPDETPDHEGQNVYYLGSKFSLHVVFSSIPFIDRPATFIAAYLPTFHVPPSRQ